MNCVKEVMEILSSKDFLPFFSSKDDTLLRNVSVRDYLGFLPIWSKVARGLEPNLSGPVYQYHGLIAVIFIYQLVKTKEIPDSGTKETLELREFFRYMEGLIEYYFHHTLNINPCYGARVVKPVSASEVVFSNREGTAVNGLYQFYRGTCRRATFTDEKGNVEEILSNILNPIIDEYSVATGVLINTLSKLSEQDEFKLVPSELFKIAGLSDLFSEIFNSPELQQHLRNRLFATKAQKEYALTCSNIFAMENRPTDKNIAQLIRLALEKENCDWPNFTKLQWVDDCETFLSLLEDCFQLLHVNDGQTLSSVTKILSTPNIKKEISKSAMVFSRLTNIIINTENISELPRFQKLRKLAELLAAEKISDFLKGLINYHSEIMIARGNAVILLLDGQIIHSVFDIAPRTKEQLIESLTSSNRFYNGYYMHNTAMLYNQLCAEDSL
jgi:hypothetical protein